MFKRLIGVFWAAAILSLPVAAQAGQNVAHTVNPGDTLYGISRQYGVQLAVLMNVNNLEGALIFPGQRLIIPRRHVFLENYNQDDVMLLARIIHAEARGESFEGKVAVGAVILNRTRNPAFPKTIRDVIYEKTNGVYQFTPVADGSINLDPDEEAIRAAIEALHGRDPTNGALFFYNPEIARDRWIRTLPVSRRIGNHIFATAA
ncbi:MAG: cell wall hydrolase [Bacillota bacterium]